MRLLLGIGSKARHGKGKAAQAIKDFSAQNNLPEVRIVNFADSLREEVTRAIKQAGSIENLLKFGVSSPDGKHVPIPSWVVPTPNPDMSDPLLPFGKHSKLLQWWGTEYRRSQDKNYWVKKVSDKVNASGGTVIITDVRFFNEALFVKESRGYLINVSRLNGDGKLFTAPDRPADHPSETELDNYPWDYFIKTHTGEEALAAEQALTLFNYLLEITQ